MTLPVTHLRSQNKAARHVASVPLSFWDDGRVQPADAAAVMVSLISAALCIQTRGNGDLNASPPRRRGSIQIRKLI